jgi:hypothetical protein
LIGNITDNDILFSILFFCFSNLFFE